MSVWDDSERNDPATLSYDEQIELALKLSLAADEQVTPPEEEIQQVRARLTEALAPIDLTICDVLFLLPQLQEYYVLLSLKTLLYGVPQDQKHLNLLYLHVLFSQ